MVAVMAEGRATSVISMKTALMKREYPLLIERFSVPSLAARRNRLNGLVGGRPLPAPFNAALLRSHRDR